MGIIKDIMQGAKKLEEMQKDTGTLSHKEWFAKHGIPSFPKTMRQKVASKLGSPKSKKPMKG